MLYAIGMDRTIKHMSIYFFNGDTPAVPAEENLITEFFYNEQGQEVREDRIDERLLYFYEKGVLVRTTHDFPDGKQKVTKYTYDEDNNLVHCHWVEQPNGAYSDEWYDWSNDGKTCTRIKETHQSDGTVKSELRREDYDEKGRLRRVHHFDDNLQFERIESMHYHPDGALHMKLQKTFYKSNDGQRREIRCRKRHVDDLMVAEENYGVNPEGKVFSHNVTFEYEKDENGNWLVSRLLNKGKRGFTVLREIEYW